MISRSIIWLLFLCFISIGFATPPHPDLLRRIRSGEIATPYFLQHEREAQIQENMRLRNHTTVLQTNAADEVSLYLVAILVDFSDRPAQINASFYDTLLFSSSRGTLRQYYDEVSYNNLHIVTNNLPSTLGWLRMPHPSSYYANGQNGFGPYPQNIARLAEDALAVADSLIDFSDYDNNLDGTIDGVMIIHAGQTAQVTGSNNDFKTCMDWVNDRFLSFDELLADRFTFCGEYSRTQSCDNLGAFAHEVGHMVWSLPDLYDYTYSSRGIDDWSLMSGGSWNGGGAVPAHPDAWSRLEARFVRPINITTTRWNLAIPCVERSPVIYRILPNGWLRDTLNQYYLMENRQRIGSDSTLPGNGLMIYHIDDQQRNGWTPENNPWYPESPDSGNYLVALEQADGRWSLEHNAAADAGDPYPGTSNNRAYTDASTPNSRLYDGSVTSVAVTSISNSSDTMFANVSINPEPMMWMVSPAGGESLILHTTVTIRWNRIVTEGGVSIDINRNYPTGVWQTIFEDVQNDNSEIWRVSGASAAHVRIRIRSVEYPNSAPAMSYTDFSIIPASIHVDRPSGGQRYNIGRNIGISWTSNLYDSTARIELNRNYPSDNWELLDASHDINTTLVWRVTGPITEHARVRVFPNIDTTICDTSDADFAIQLSDGVTEPSAPVLPYKFLISNVYPNPFNNETNINCDFPTSGSATVKFFTAEGREIESRTISVQPGRMRIPWRPVGLSSGIYLVRVQLGENQVTGKLLLIR